MKKLDTLKRNFFQNQVNPIQMFNSLNKFIEAVVVRTTLRTANKTGNHAKILAKIYPYFYGIFIHRKHLDIPNFS